MESEVLNMNALIDSEQNESPYSENSCSINRTILKIGEVKNYASMSSSLSFNQSNSPAVVLYMTGHFLSNAHTLITPESIKIPLTVCLRFYGYCWSQSQYLLFRPTNRSLYRSCFETHN